MNTTDDKTLTTADLAAAADQREQARRQDLEAQRDARDERAMRDADRRTADRDATMRQPPRQQDMQANVAERQEAQGERLAPLFLPQIAERFRSRWDEVQIGFVDDPHRAVKDADELVAQVMKSLAETFADERANIDSQVDQSDTEHLRVALRRYRSFFQRLLSL
jgi:hypothetical protein